MPSGRSQPRRFAPPGASAAPPAPITSTENRWLKRFRGALAGESGEPGVAGIEGPHLVEEAVRSGVEILAVLASPAGEKHVENLGLGTAATSGARPPLLRTTDRLFASLAGTETPQGIAALVRLPEYRFEDLLRGVPLVVVLAGVQDPGNVGAIVRSAEAFGATGLVAAAGTSSPLGPKAMRASAGSIFRLPVIMRGQPPVLLAQLKVAGLQLVATVAQMGAAMASVAGSGDPAGHHHDQQTQPKQGESITRSPIAPHLLDLRGPVALLVGSEPRGLPESVLLSADAIASIPLAAPVESLNAAVAASVLLYEAARQRQTLERW